MDELFQRHNMNPILTAEEMPIPVNSVFNAGATVFQDDMLLLLRVEDRRGHSQLYLAKSRDGISEWRIEKEPLLFPDPIQHPEEEWGVEDARITFLQDIGKWAILYTSFSKWGTLVSMVLTKDFKNFERFGSLLPPENKDAALFPIKFNNSDWVIIHRPTSPRAGSQMWISYSPDLKHWGRHRPLLRSRDGSWWDSGKVGLSCPPIITEKGWLLLYHGVKQDISAPIYRLGLVLLNKQNPHIVTARSDEWVFSPKEDYERVGDVGNVVFSCGWVIRGEEVFLYYGGADTCICLAKANLPELLVWLENHNSV